MKPKSKDAKFVLELPRLEAALKYGIIGGGIVAMCDQEREQWQGAGDKQRIAYALEIINPWLKKYERKRLKKG